MYIESLTRLSNDIIKLIHNSEGYDVKIKVGESPNTQEFKAHSLILRARSPYFNRALSHDWTRKQENFIVFEKPNVSPNIFEIILRYIYGDIFKLEDYDPFDILDFLIAADELMVDDGLIDHVQTYLIHSKSVWINENLLDILTVISPCDSCQLLREYCLDKIISQDLITFFDADWFPSINEFILLALLQRDDLGLSETVLWRYVLKWGILNTIGLEKNIEQWSPEDFTTLKTTLRRCIPHIRFFQMSCSDFYQHVQPFAMILPENLLNNITLYHQMEDHNLIILPQPRSPAMRINSSVIINSKCGKNIINLIEKNPFPSNNKNINCAYDFNLLYRASCDEYQSFHKNCDNIGWFSFSRGSKDCFIFSLGTDEKKAELEKEVKWPDLYVSLKRDRPFGYRQNRCYKSKVFNRQGSFKWEDWEVFQIIKKAQQKYGLTWSNNQFDWLKGIRL
ncbi:6239_t:CDS:2 [Scutellospora calospora]|uniref:6239_t:CDS:1 n=1 Tax=Scutellospora calospora TaxID=85575 RepID=A0ACA9JU22_9GLOM|nr:6239_t:CDS:2 [Scutellospora calospora]